jgi:hypothetical protein
LTAHAANSYAPHFMSVELTVERLWSWCSKCLGLYYSGASLGLCPNGGEHTLAGSGCYTLWSAYAPHDQPPPNIPGTQAGFLRCSTCQGLFHVGRDKGRCSSEPHRPVASQINSTFMFRWYWLPWQDGSAPAPLVPGQTPQTGWRWCRACEGIFHAGSGSGACFAGVGHDASKSGAYAPTLGPLFAAPFGAILARWPAESAPLVAGLGADGVLKLEPYSYNIRTFFVEPTGDGRFWLRASLNNLYVVVNSNTQALVACTDRDHATRFTVTHLGAGKLRFEHGGARVTAPDNTTDPLQLKPPASAQKGVPTMVLAADRTLFTFLGLH